MAADQLYFRQLLSGRDFAVADPVAQQMVNFVYAIGDRTSGECVLVDPAYAVGELLERGDCPIHVQRDEAPWVTRTTGVGEGQLIEHAPGDVVSVGDVDITLVHTPGHTP